MPEITVDVGMIAELQEKRSTVIQDFLLISLLKIDLCSIIKPVDISNEIKKSLLAVGTKNFFLKMLL